MAQHGNAEAEAHNLGCKSQKLVKNCSNFLLVKQTSQTNRPQLFVAAAKSAIPQRRRQHLGFSFCPGIQVQLLLLLPRQDTFRSLSRLLALNLRRCQYFVNLRRSPLAPLGAEGKTRTPRRYPHPQPHPRLTFSSLWSALALGLCGLFWAKFAYNKPHQ